MSVVGTVLYTVDKTQHTQCSLQEGLTFRKPRGVMESLNPEFALSGRKTVSTRTNTVFWLLT